MKRKKKLNPINLRKLLPDMEKDRELPVLRGREKKEKNIAEIVRKGKNTKRVVKEEEEHGV